MEFEGFVFLVLKCWKVNLEENYGDDVFKIFEEVEN